MLILQCIWHGLKHICVGIILWFSWTSYEIEDIIFDVDIAVYLAWSKAYLCGYYLNGLVGHPMR